MSLYWHFQGDTITWWCTSHPTCDSSEPSIGPGGVELLMVALIYKDFTTGLIRQGKNLRRRNSSFSSE